jgi:hypothetical protein
MSSRTLVMHRSKGQEQSRARDAQGNMVRIVRQGIIAKTAYYECQGSEVHMEKKK